MKKWILGATLGLSCVIAQAEAPRLRWYANLGYAMGGDPLVSGNWVDGTGQVVGSFDIKAGDGYVMALGADVRLGDRISLQASIGHQSKRLAGADANISFERNPAELLGFYSITTQIRLGVGVRKSLNARVTGSDRAAGFSGVGPYESSPGAVLELQYLFNDPSSQGRAIVTGLQLRVVKESFRLSDGYGSTEDKKGDHVALGLLFYY